MDHILLRIVRPLACQVQMEIGPLIMVAVRSGIRVTVGTESPPEPKLIDPRGTRSTVFPS